MYKYKFQSMHIHVIKNIKVTLCKNSTAFIYL